MNPITEVDVKQVEKVIFDTGNPNSLINRVWPQLVPYVRAVADVYPQYFLSNENRVKAFCKPDERDHRVRLKFWDEYYQSTQLDRKMDYMGIMHGAMAVDTWDHVYLPDRKKLLWVFTQPATYTSSMRHLLEKGMERLHEIMDMPLMVKRNGRLEPDIRMISQVLKAFQLVDLRVKGSVVQRMQIEQRSVNLNHNVESNQDALKANLGMLSLKQLREMEDQLDRLEQKRSKVVAMLPEGEKREVEEVTTITIPRVVEFAKEGRDYGKEETWTSEE